MLVDFTISVDEMCVQGHFPDAPVVPGAYLLAKMDAAVREYLPGRSLSGFSKVKFLAPLLPNQNAQLAVILLPSGRVQLEVRHLHKVLVTAHGVLD